MLTKLRKDSGYGLSLIVLTISLFLLLIIGIVLIQTRKKEIDYLTDNTSKKGDIFQTLDEMTNGQLQEYRNLIKD